MEEKQCATCKETKPYEAFAYNGAYKRYETSCRMCRNNKARKKRYGQQPGRVDNEKQIYERNRRRDREQWLIDYLLAHPCVDCGEHDPIVLDFDHVKEPKLFSITVAISHGYALKTIEEEIAKCAVRCANCHRRETAKRQGWLRYYLLGKPGG